MKRLLAYLFVVLGLGLMCSVNSHAVNKTDLFCVTPGITTSTTNISQAYKMRKNDKCKNKIVYPHDEYYSSLNNTWEEFKKKNTWGGAYPGDLFKVDAELRLWIFKNIKPKNIVKAEPSQKQKVPKNKLICTVANKIYWYEKDKCSSSFSQIIKPDHSMYDWFHERAIYFPDTTQTTKIAKAEASQTQNTASAYYGDSLCVDLSRVEFLKNDSTNCRGGIKQIIRKNHSMYDYFFSKIDKTQIVKKDEVNQKAQLAFCLSKIKETNAFVVKQLGIDSCEGENIIIAQNDIENLNLFNSLKERFEITDGALIVTNEQIEIFSNNENTKLVSKQKQDEFKPENKDVDKDAPIIEIAQNIIVDSQTYTLKGRVKDKSRFFLTIDDRPIKVAKNGQFEFEGFAIDPKEQLKIVAIDRWKNKSEKIINIEVKIKQVADIRSYEKPNPSKIKVKKDNNKIGIIIGIEKYQNLNNIDAPYANRDAKAFKAYANIALGIPSNNLKVLIDEDATRGELLKSLKIWLPQITRGKEKDIYIFFAGHGLASDNGEDLHILPHNGDPILLEDTALSRIEMFDLINKVNPKSVTMFFDTCYSGQTRSEQMLIAGLRPVRIVADEQDTPNNFTIFTASNYDQTSGSINEAEHGIFSYYLMKGLEGKADENSDKKITNGELISYLKNNVTQEAFSQNRSQEPMLSGDPDKVLISYK